MKTHRAIVAPDFFQKKDLGAFYTPELYASKAIELVRDAIARVPPGNDYIILDRCAGTGNLESGLSDEELSHCIVSTKEYYEYKVLLELLGSKVRHIVPPTEKPETFNAGYVMGADALSREYIEEAVIQQYVNNPSCTIILFENPPYAETTSAEHQRKGAGKNSSETWKSSFAVSEMKRDIRGKVKGSPSNDMGNAFIWSGFRYYLRQPTDSYIVFSPVKYWKAQHLVKKKFLRGYAFNRRYFHTKIDACIMCALWANIDDTKTDELQLTAFDIEDGRLVEYPQPLPVKRIYQTYSQVFYEKRAFPQAKDGILCALDGTERPIGRNPNRIADEKIVCYMVAHSSGFDNPDLDSSLLVAARYDGNGFFVYKDNYLEKLPMFAASRYIAYNRTWTERARIMKSADGADRFLKDIKNGKLSQFLLKCLLFTCLEAQNHMRTFWGSDGRFYRNELCLDTTNGETLASADIAKLRLNDRERTLLRQWEQILYYAKQVDKYDATLTYGVFQIFAELDTSHKDDKTGKTVWDNRELHSALQSLRENIKPYYNEEIVPILFEYELLK